MLHKHRRRREQPCHAHRTTSRRCAKLSGADQASTTFGDHPQCCAFSGFVTSTPRSFIEIGDQLNAVCVGSHMKPRDALVTNGYVTESSVGTF